MNRNIHLGILLLVLSFFASCDMLEDQTVVPEVFDFRGDPVDMIMTPCADSDEIRRADLPQSVRRYLADRYRGVGVKKAERFSVDGELFYGVKLRNGKELYFNANGDLLAEGDDDDDRYEHGSWGDDHPEFDRAYDRALEYLQQHHPDLIDEIEKAEIEFEYGQLFVEVEFHHDRKMYFTAGGELICAFSDDRDDHGEDDHGNDDDHEVHIPVNQLPQAALDYIADKFPNATIVKAERDDSENQYEVLLDNNYKLYFTLDGNFIKKKKKD